MGNGEWRRGTILAPRFGHSGPSMWWWWAPLRSGFFCGELHFVFTGQIVSESEIALVESLVDGTSLGRRGGKKPATDHQPCSTRPYLGHSPRLEHISPTQGSHHAMRNTKYEMRNSKISRNNSGLPRRSRSRADLGPCTRYADGPHAGGTLCQGLLP